MKRKLKNNLAKKGAIKFSQAVFANCVSKKIFIATFTLLFLLLNSNTAHAITMSNPLYKLQTGPKIIKRQDPAQKPVPSSTAEPQNPATLELLQLTISASVIDFGILAPTNPSVRTHNLNIKSLYPYSLLAVQDHPLESQDHTIPNTTCDSGTCGQFPNSWKSNLTFGSGFRCDSNHNLSCKDEFVSNKSAFMPFATSFTTSLFATGLPAKEAEARIIYKVNISKNILPGLYTNTINYMLIPNL